MAAEQFVVLAGAEEQALTKLADYREAGGFAALAVLARADTPAGRGSRPARRRRR